MRFFDYLSRKKGIEEFSAGPVFIGEQDGVPERALKQSLSALFSRNAEVQKAFLARAHYGDAKNSTVCLAIAARNIAESALVREVQTVFASQFNRSAHLDIVFLTSKQERRIASVCRPFYQAA